MTSITYITTEDKRQKMVLLVGHCFSMFEHRLVLSNDLNALFVLISSKIYKSEDAWG